MSDDDAPPACLRSQCDDPTVYGSPACLGHWQVWRDEEVERVALEWGLDDVPSEVEEELQWQHRQRGVS